MILSNKQITKALIRGWSAPLLFANLRRQVFLRRGPYNKKKIQIFIMKCTCILSCELKKMYVFHLNSLDEINVIHSRCSVERYWTCYQEVADSNLTGRVALFDLILYIPVNNVNLRCFSKSRSSSGSTTSVRLSAILLGCLVCVIYNSNSFHSFIFKLCIMIVHTLKMCTSYFMHI